MPIYYSEDDDDDEDDDDYLSALRQAQFALHYQAMR